MFTTTFGREAQHEPRPANPWLGEGGRIIDFPVFGESPQRASKHALSARKH
jgi:hypothetical protein